MKRFGIKNLTYNVHHVLVESLSEIFGDYVIGGRDIDERDGILVVRQGHLERGHGDGVVGEVKHVDDQVGHDCQHDGDEGLKLMFGHSLICITKCKGALMEIIFTMIKYMIQFRIVCRALFVIKPFI